MLNVENYMDIVIALIIIASFAIFALFANFFIKKIAEKWVKRTKTSLDDEILRAIKFPVFLIVLFIGIYAALMELNILMKYHQDIQKIFTSIFILIFSFLTTRIINAVIRWYSVYVALKTETKFNEQFMPIIRKIIIGFIYAIAILLILQTFDIEITPLLASLGIIGLAVALALKDTLSNFFAGVYIIADRPIKIGDFIEIENGMKGYVVDIGWRSVRIKTIENNYIIIPNSRLAQSIITNYYDPTMETSIVVPCGVSYGSDLEKVEKVTVEVAKEIQQTVPGAVKNFEPFIRYNEFGDSNINFSIILRVEKFVDRYLIVHEFIKKLKERYNKEGIEISFPVRNVHIKNTKDT